MEGVILYADDHIHSDGRMERQLFEELRSDLPVLGVNSLELAAKAVRSIGSFGAIILDWQFSPGDENKAMIEALLGEGVTAKEAGIRGASVKEDATLKFLLDNNFYSLVYIFSEQDVDESHGEQLKVKYGDRIKIKKKADFNKQTPSEIKKAILDDINKWRDDNKNLSVPIKWSAAINESLQSIFKDLSDADKDWIKDLYQSGKKDGVSPEVFLIELFQLLLMEELVQNHGLLESLKTEGEIKVLKTTETQEGRKKSLSKLFSRLYYSQLLSTAPMMTGDIFQLSEEEFAILITPECDIFKIFKSKLSFDLLLFKKNSLAQALKDDGKVFSERENLFNQPLSTWHFMPSLPFLSDEFKTGCAVNFRTGSIKISSEQIGNYDRKYKLNSPFIQALRQRYLSHLGRVGTPHVHDLVRDFNLEDLTNSSGEPAVKKVQAAAPQVQKPTSSKVEETNGSRPISSKAKKAGVPANLKIKKASMSLKKRKSKGK